MNFILALDQSEVVVKRTSFQASEVAVNCQFPSMHECATRQGGGVEQKTHRSG